MRIVFVRIRMMQRRKWSILIFIFVIALFVRFYSFRESIYFGFDQARDIYISQDIFLKKDLKFVGPPVSGDVGLYHGVLFWYILGPISLLLKGNPLLISAVFRIFNALGVFLVYVIGKRIFNSRVAWLSALFFAISFEQSQYAMFVSNPSLGVLAIMLIFLGATFLLKNKKKSGWAMPIMFTGAAISTQLNLMFAYTFLIVLVIMFLFKERVAKIKIKYFMGTLMATLAILSTYVLSEIKYGFKNIKTAFSLLNQGYEILDPQESKYLLYGEKYLRMFKDNLLGLINNNYLIAIVMILITAWVLINSIKNKRYALISVWILSWIVLMIFGGHLAYYTNAGISVGILVLAAVILEKIFSYHKLLAFLLVVGIIAGNIKQIIVQSPKSLLVEFTPQPMMRLVDEYDLIDNMYKSAEGRGFTVRLTGIPYKVQTVWSYLFHHYAEKKYGYLPFWENGNILGFPGELPVPKKGTTCLRFRIVEPARGIPDHLIEADIETENLFSSVVNKTSQGDFLLETRKAKDSYCHNNKP